MPPKRPSKLVKSLSLSAREEAEIAEAWMLFASAAVSEDAGEPAVATGDVRKALMALGLNSTRDELAEILEVVDPDGDGYVVWPRFLEVVALKLRHGGDKVEVEDAFRLFTQGERITVDDLMRLAEKLREDVTEVQIRDMITEATGSAAVGVDIRAFEGVMKRAGLF